MKIYNECTNWRMKCIKTYFSKKILSFNCEMRNTRKGGGYSRPLTINVLINPFDSNLDKSCDCSKIVLEEWEGRHIEVDGIAFIADAGTSAILKMWAKRIKIVDEED